MLFRSAISLMPDAMYELPYEGAKEMLLVDDVDNKVFLTRLFNTMYEELPNPKKRNSKSQVCGGRCIMVVLIESIVGCLVFTILFGGMTYINPLSMIHDYPPAIQNKAKELGLITDEQKRYSKTDIIRKIIGIFIFGLMLAFIVFKLNDADTFIKGFGCSYLLWNIVNWWDAIFIDCIWFCHSKKFVIPETEGMKEYKDYLFHIKASLKGMLFGIPACLLAGLLVLIF